MSYTVADVQGVGVEAPDALVRPRVSTVVARIRAVVQDLQLVTGSLDPDAVAPGAIHREVTEAGATRHAGVAVGSHFLLVDVIVAPARPEATDRVLILLGDLLVPTHRRVDRGHTRHLLDTFGLTCGHHRGAVHLLSVVVLVQLVPRLRGGDEGALSLHPIAMKTKASHAVDVEVQDEEELVLIVAGRHEARNHLRIVMKTKEHLAVVEARDEEELVQTVAGLHVEASLHRIAMQMKGNLVAAVDVLLRTEIGHHEAESRPVNRSVWGLHPTGSSFPLIDRLVLLQLFLFVRMKREGRRAVIEVRVYFYRRISWC